MIKCGDIVTVWNAQIGSEHGPDPEAPNAYEYERFLNQPCTVEGVNKVYYTIRNEDIGTTTLYKWRVKKIDDVFAEDFNANQIDILF